MLCELKVNTRKFVLNLRPPVNVSKMAQLLEIDKLSYFISS